MNKVPKTKAHFIHELTSAIEGELLTHLVFNNDDVKDLVESTVIIRHMIYEMCGSLTRGVLNEADNKSNS